MGKVIRLNEVTEMYIESYKKLLKERYKEQKNLLEQLNDTSILNIAMADAIEYNTRNILNKKEDTK